LGGGKSVAKGPEKAVAAPVGAGGKGKAEKKNRQFRSTSSGSSPNRDRGLWQREVCENYTGVRIQARGLVWGVNNFYWHPWGKP